MFDGIQFTGTINVGNISVAIINLIGVIALYFRIKAKIKEYDLEHRKPGGMRKTDPPANVLTSKDAGNNSEDKPKQ